MRESRRKTLTVLGCVCFGLSVAVNISYLIQYRTFGGMHGALIYLLLAAALAFRSPFLLTASGILLAAECVIGAVTDYTIFQQTQSLVVPIQGALNVIASILILLLGFSKRKSVLFGWLAAALLLLKALLVYYGWHIPALCGLPQQVTALNVTLSAATVVGWIVTGYLRREMPTFGETWNRLLNK